MSFLDSMMSNLGGEAAVVSKAEQLATHLGNGGLEDIVNKLHQNGLGDVVKSWVGTGANLPVNPAQLIQALGSSHVAQLTSALGIDANSLATVLPSIIDHLTPNGQMPSGDLKDTLTSALKSGVVNNLLGSLLK